MGPVAPGRAGLERDRGSCLTGRGDGAYRSEAAGGVQESAGESSSAAGRLVLPAANQTSSLSSSSPACQADPRSSWPPVRIQSLAVSAGTTVTVTGLRRMPVDIGVRSVCSLG